MRFPAPLVRATLLRRYKRFLADVRLEDGTELTAHCPNSGTMMGLNAPGSEVWLSPAHSAGRKLPYTLELVRAGGLVGVNTGWPNVLAEEAIRTQRISELTGYETVRREVPYGKNSRIDLLLEGGGRPPCLVEVKNVHLRRGDGTAAEFPDCVTARGAKHLVELQDMVADGRRAVMLYVVQREDCDHFRLAADLDPTYAAAFAIARAGGVEALCYSCKVGREAIELVSPLPIDEAKI
ncbi:MAG: DNA/RNA nuclease SfsA [Alphaproteobacteria bacterium]